MYIDKFDPTSPDDILRYAGGLVGKSLAEVSSRLPISLDLGHKGRLGNLVEEYYFGFKPNNNSEPDFPAADLELKVTGLSKSGTRTTPPRAKERLSLTLINYNEIVNETFETSSFFRKCQRMLVLCYQFDPTKRAVDQKFTRHQFIYSLAAGDIQDIKRDWEFIQAKVREGKAHEISEGDTYFLKASRKGAGGDRDLTEQPFSDIKANRRGWSFNASYLSSIIEKAAVNDVPFSTHRETTLEFETHSVISRYVGRSSRELFKEFSITNSKQMRHQLLMKMLGGQAGTRNLLVRSGIQLKTVRLKRNGKTREAMSFPAFKYEEVANQTWEESDFFEVTESKFLLAVFQEDGQGIERLTKVSYWNMPFEDRQAAKDTWEETKKSILDGTYSFPTSEYNDVAHVRPKGRNGADKALCPDGLFRGKKCFWLNQRYIEQVVANINDELI